MKIQIDIEEKVDDGGTASYRAWYGKEFVSEWRETKWEAIQDLAEKIAVYEDQNEIEVK